MKNTSIKIKNLNKITLFLLITVFFCFYTSLSEEIKPGEYTKAILGYASWWWAFFIFGIILIIIGIAIRDAYPNHSKKTLYAGLVLAFIGMFLAQISYVLPLIPVVRGIDIFVCSEAQNLSFTENVACLFSGLYPKGNVWSFIVWFIFLFVLPLSILISLFFEFTTASIILDPNARKVIAFASALIAYRFLMGYLFVEFISVGLGGIALFFVNILLFGWAVGGIRRLFAHVEMVKKMRETQDLAQLERLMRMREDIYAAWQAALRAQNTQLAQELMEQLNDIDKQINKLSEKSKKTDSLSRRVRSPPSPS